MLEYLKQGYALYAMVGVSLLGIIGKLAANHIYKRLIKQSENIGTAKDKYLKQIKAKYETAYRTNEGIHNIPVFIEKSFYRYKRFGFRLQKLDNFATQGALLCFLIGLVATLTGFLYDADMKTLVVQFSAGIILGVSMILFDGITDTMSKREALLVHIQDYLENHLTVQLMKTKVSVKEPTLRPSIRGGMRDDIFVRRKEEKVDKFASQEAAVAKEEPEEYHFTEEGKERFTNRKVARRKELKREDKERTNNVAECSGSIGASSVNRVKSGFSGGGQDKSEWSRKNNINESYEMNRQDTGKNQEERRTMDEGDSGISQAAATSERIKDMEELKKSLASIAAIREQKGTGSGGKPKKLTPKEERLIEEIIQEYLS